MGLLQFCLLDFVRAKPKHKNFLNSHKKKLEIINSAEICKRFSGYSSPQPVGLGSKMVVEYFFVQDSHKTIKAEES